MAASFTAGPNGDIAYVGQPLVYTAQTSTTPTADLRIWYTVEESTGTGTWQQIGKYYLALNGASRTHFDLNDVLDQRLKLERDKNGADIHTLSGSILLNFTPAITSCIGYRITIGEFDGATEGSADDSVTVVINSGQVGRPTGADRYASDEFEAKIAGNRTKYWMVTQPITNPGSTVPQMDYFVDPEDDGVLTFICTPAFTTGGAGDVDYAPNYYAYGIYDGTTLMATGTQLILGGPPLYTSDPLVAGNSMVHWCGFPKRILSSASYSGAWTRVHLQMFNASTVALGGILRFNKECIYADGNYARLAFANGLGGYGYMNFEGRVEKQVQRTQKTVNRVRGTYDAATWSLDMLAGDQDQYGVTTSDKYKLHTIVKFRDMHLVEEMIASRVHSLQLIRGQDFIPVVLDTRSVDIKLNPGGNIAEVTVEVTDAIKSYA